MPEGFRKGSTHSSRRNLKEHSLCMQDELFHFCINQKRKMNNDNEKNQMISRGFHQRKTFVLKRIFKELKYRLIKNHIK